MNLQALKEKKPVIELKTLEEALKDCIPELYPQFQFVSLVITTPNADGVMRIRDAKSGIETNITNDSTPPADVLQAMKTNQARGAIAHNNPWWTYAIAAVNSPQLRPGEKRYPELYMAPKLDWFRTQIHEAGTALTILRTVYHPGPWAPPTNNLDPDHGDDGPAMEDCVGKRVYAKLGLKPVNVGSH